MSEEPFSFIDYLAAKKTVDDRALNRQVYGALQFHLSQSHGGEEPLQVLEIAAGLGNMFERLLDWELFVGDVVYTAVDVSADYLAIAREQLPRWADAREFEVEILGADHFLLRRDGQKIEWRSQAADVFQFLNEAVEKEQRWDLVLGHAFIDLVDQGHFLPLVVNQLTEDGLLYLTINFDGQTILLPPTDEKTDALLMAEYHLAMDEPPETTDPRFRGTSRSSQALLVELPKAGAEIVAAGSSDWVVFGKDGEYPHQEAHFLHCIVSTINNSLLGRVDGAMLRPWIAERHRQIDNGELSYIAHQLDFLARRQP